MLKAMHGPEEPSGEGRGQGRAPQGAQGLPVCCSAAPTQQIHCRLSPFDSPTSSLSIPFLPVPGLQNDLRPDISKAPWTPQEEYILARAHSERGNQWSEIALYLHRSENTIKNKWWVAL
jgi:hypothetical protein